MKSFTFAKVLVLSLVFLGFSPVFALPSHPVYVGLQAGGSITDFPGFEGSGLYAARVFGGFSFTQNIGVEVGYGSYRSALSSNAKIEQYAYDFLSVWSLHFVDHLSGYTKIGMAQRGATLKPVSGNKVSDSALRFAFAFGLNYDLSAHLLTSIEWYHIQSKSGTFFNDTDLSSIDFIALGLTYRF